MADGLGAPLEAPLFERLALIGLGLIGSSIARVAKRKNLARRIVASDAAPDVRAKVAELGLADDVAESAAKAVEGADLVILCVPVGAMAAVAQEIAPHLSPGAIVSDVGSVKGAVLTALTDICRKTSPSFPPIPLPAPSNPAPTRDSRHCSSTAGAF